MKRALYEAWRALPQDNVWSAAAPLEALWKDDCDGGGGWVEGIARAGGNLLIYLGTCSVLVLVLVGLKYAMAARGLGERGVEIKGKGDGLCIGNH